MKTKLQIALLVFAQVACMAVFADQPGYEVKGSILDEKSGSHVKDAKVYLELNGEILLETKTKADGSFNFKLSNEQIKAKDIKVRIEKNGYKTEIRQSVPGKDVELNVLLKERVKQVPIMVPKMSPTSQYIIV